MSTAASGFVAIEVIGKIATDSRNRDKALSELL